MAYALTTGLRKLRTARRKARKAARKAAQVARDAAEGANRAAVEATVAARGAIKSRGNQKLKAVARRASMGRRRSTLNEDDMAVTEAAAAALRIAEGDEGSGAGRRGGELARTRVSSCGARVELV